MSDNHDASAHAPGHGASTMSKQAVATLLLSLIVPILIIVALVSYSTTDRRPAPSPADAELATAARIQKVGTVEVGEAVHVLKSGEEVFKARCSACHATGAAGSPKFGDAGAWGPRIKAGFDALWNSALKGKNGMPPQAGGDLTDFEIARGVVYMANAGGAKFAEPKAPEAAK